MLLNPRATFSLAVRLREPDGAEIGEVFSFLSKLYFRGKLTYAREFASAADGVPPILVITADRGLVPPDARLRRDDLEQFCQVDISTSDERYLAPLRRDASTCAALRGFFTAEGSGGDASGNERAGMVDVRAETKDPA